MSLRHSSSGILETHVTWEEFEANLAKALGTTAHFGPKKSALDIGEGFGFSSRCALIDCDWQGEDKEELPSRVALKMGSCLALQKMMGDAPPEAWIMMEKGIRSMHNVECYAYELIGQFGRAHAVPRIYYSNVFDEEICMEYVEQAQMMRSGEAATIGQMKQIVRALGKLQADSTKVVIDSNSLKTEDVFAEFTKTMPKEHFLRSFDSFKKLEPSLSEHFVRVEAIMAEYYGSSLPSTLHRQLGMRPVLVNGDLRTENVLVGKESGDLTAIIDWQLAHLGVGVEDLLRISFFAQSTEDRRASASALIEEMYNTFTVNLYRSTRVPFTLQQLKEAYDLLFPHCALFFACGLGLLMKPNKPQPGEENEEKKRRYEVVLDKARGVLEDNVVYHEKNRCSKLDWNYQ